jgi:hypothetical protein
MRRPDPVASDEAGARIAAWRESGGHRFDPVRFHFIEALAARSAVHDGEARRLLDDRVASLVADYGDALEAARAAEGDAARPPEKLPARPGPLALLVEQVARQAPPPASGELKTLGYFRSTWARLSAERRLTQSLAKVPENAGPLNSHHLVHRSLTLMRDLSPEYLNRFMSYVDTLLWLDQASAGTGTAAPESPRKTARGKTAG